MKPHLNYQIIYSVALIITLVITVQTQAQSLVQTYDPQPISVHDLTNALLINQQAYSTVTDAIDNSYSTRVLAAIITGLIAITWCSHRFKLEEELDETFQYYLKWNLWLMLGTAFIGVLDFTYNHLTYQNNIKTRDNINKLHENLKDLCKKVNNNTTCVY